MNLISFLTTSQKLDHLPQFLVLKDFYQKYLINSNNVFERNYRFFNHDEFKSEFIDIPWNNIQSSDDISVSLAFNLYFERVNTLLDEHAPNHKPSKKKISLKAKPWIYKNIQARMRECDKLFQRYWNDRTLKVANHSKYENARNVIIFKAKKSKKEYYQNYLLRVF